MPWWGHCHCRSLKHSYASYKDSSVYCLKLVSSWWYFIVLPGRKYLVRKAFKSKSYEVIEFGANEFNHNFAFSLKENGNNLRRIASVLTPFILKGSQISKKVARCAFGSSLGNPPNWYCETIWIMASLISKLLASIVGLTILLGFPSGLGIV